VRRLTGCLALLALLLAGCVRDTGVEQETAAADTEGVTVGGAGDCTVVDIAVSVEKIDLFVDLAEQFNASPDAQLDGGGCAVMEPRAQESGRVATLLSEGWPDPDVNGVAPVVWSPASSAWSGVANQRLADAGQPPIAPAGEPFMLSPLVIGMPQPMAEALGYPEEPLGWGDILTLARDAEGWGTYGHPEWGPFRLAKTNPTISTTGLSALIAQYYAATGKTEDLTTEDLARPEVDDFARGVESAVVHYGDTILTFLNNLARNDARGTALTYASAVATAEVSLINYNRGNPDGVLEPGEELVPPRVPLVAIYPEEGTLFNDNPFVVLDAEWVDDTERAAAERFGAFVQRPENQQRVLEFGYRPGNPEVPLGEPITAEFGVDPTQPQTALELPEPPVLVDALERWDVQRKGARVLITMDVSGSMGDPAGAETRETKLDLAKQAAIGALDDFSPDDEVGLRVFSTDLSPTEPTDYIDLVPIGPIAEQRDVLAQRIEQLVPTTGTPLYTATAASYSDLVDAFDPQRINAIILLSDGVNDDPNNDDLDGLLATLTEGTEGGTETPVRIFPIAYGSDADLGSLRRIAEATNAAVYDASDPGSIDRVFTAVVSNF